MRVRAAASARAPSPSYRRFILRGGGGGDDGDLVGTDGTCYWQTDAFCVGSAVCCCRHGAFYEHSITPYLPLPSTWLRDGTFSLCRYPPPDGSWMCWRVVVIAWTRWFNSGPRCSWQPSIPATYYLGARWRARALFYAWRALLHFTPLHTHTPATPLFRQACHITWPLRHVVPTYRAIVGALLSMLLPSLPPCDECSAICGWVEFLVLGCTRTDRRMRQWWWTLFPFCGSDFLFTTTPCPQLAHTTTHHALHTIPLCRHLPVFRQEGDSWTLYSCLLSAHSACPSCPHIWTGGGRLAATVGSLCAG